MTIKVISDGPAVDFIKFMMIREILKIMIDNGLKKEEMVAAIKRDFAKKVNPNFTLEEYIEVFEDVWKNL